MKLILTRLGRIRTCAARKENVKATEPNFVDLTTHWLPHNFVDNELDILEFSSSHVFYFK